MLRRHARRLAGAGVFMRQGMRIVLLFLIVGLSACGGYDGAPVDPAPSPGGGVPTPVPQTGRWPIDIVRGKSEYAQHCQACHAAEGRGGSGPALNNASCLTCADYDELWQTIEQSMPLRSPRDCDRRCARDVAGWITNGFSTEPSCAVDFDYVEITMDAFVADIGIRNFRGLDVERWSLTWTPDQGQRITAADGAMATEAAGEMHLTPNAGATRIADGEQLMIRIEGTHEGRNAVPDDLHLVAPPCFAAAPASE